jgi:hypothetical protein
MPTDTPIEYAIVSAAADASEYVNGIRTLPPSNVDRLDAKKRADLRPITRTADPIDPATQRPGEPVVSITADAVTIHTPAVDLNAREKTERTTERNRARRAAILAVSAQRAAIAQAIADKQLPANTPLPEYPA